MTAASGGIGKGVAEALPSWRAFRHQRTNGGRRSRRSPRRSPRCVRRPVIVVGDVGAKDGRLDRRRGCGGSAAASTCLNNAGAARSIKGEADDRPSRKSKSRELDFTAARRLDRAASSPDGRPRAEHPEQATAEAAPGADRSELAGAGAGRLRRRRANHEKTTRPSSCAPTTSTRTSAELASASRTTLSIWQVFSRPRSFTPLFHP